MSRATGRIALVSAFAIALAMAPAALRAQEFGHQKGSTSASVLIVEFADFACGYCGRFVRETLPQLEPEIESGRVRLVVIPFELFPRGRTAARAAECAAQQSRFWEMHDLLYQKQKEWMPAADQASHFRRYAGELGLGSSAFASCMERKSTQPVTDSYTRSAANCRINGTPTFFINGLRIVGAHPLETFRQVIATVRADARLKPAMPGCAVS
jgi:protein-disulfide isomerase